MTQSPDGTWTAPRVLMPMSADNDVPKVVANKLIVLSTGEWILPFWRQKSWKVRPGDVTARLGGRYSPTVDWTALLSRVAIRHPRARVVCLGVTKSA
eukprot:165539-Pyramimonas_sp.AAC.1